MLDSNCEFAFPAVGRFDFIKIYSVIQQLPNLRQLCEFDVDVQDKNFTTGRNCGAKQTQISRKATNFHTFSSPGSLNFNQRLIKYHQRPLETQMTQRPKHFQRCLSNKHLILSHYNYTILSYLLSNYNVSKNFGNVYSVSFFYTTEVYSFYYYFLWHRIYCVFQKTLYRK